MARGSARRLYEYDGGQWTLQELYERYCTKTISIGNLACRIQRGMGLHKSLTVPKQTRGRGICVQAFNDPPVGPTGAG